jgi:hypothetical protein
MLKLNEWLRLKEKQLNLSALELSSKLGLKNAKEWMRADTELWEVECDGITPVEEYVNLPTDEEAMAFWRGEREITENGKKVSISTLKYNSEFYGCNELKMIRKVV